MRWLLFLVLPVPMLTACGEDPPKTALPDFEDPALVQGKNTWMQVCRACHLQGVAGAPAISDSKAWQQRLSKGRQALYQSAINGIPSAEGWSMPPRGGMDRLTDAQVRTAVDYMLAAQAEISEAQPN